MLKDISQKLYDLDDNVVVQMGKDVTMKDIIIDVLMDNTIDGAHLTGDQKLERYTLAVRCKPSGEIEFSPEEIVSLKQLVGKKHNPLIVGQFFNFVK
jgi:hypothetical protein